MRETNGKKLMYLVKNIIPQKVKPLISRIYVDIFSKITLISDSVSPSNPYVLCDVDGVQYIGFSDDRGLMKWMIAKRENWAKKEIISFFELSKEYFGYDDRNSGIFVDIGANIGTTFVFFKKILCKRARVLAFEPDPDSIRLAKINTTLNFRDCSSIKIEQLGIGEKEEDVVLYKHPENPGGNSIINAPTNSIEHIHVISLDSYIEANDVPQEQISYIWIDTEGFEPYVMFGARKLLENNNIPVFLEFNPHVYKEIPGLYLRMIDFIDSLFSFYIMIQDGTKHSISELLDYKECDFQIGDIMLIK